MYLLFIILDDLMHLSGSMVASSFGKIVMKDNPRDGIKEEDFAIALLMMITNNIGQIAYLNAKLHGCTKIFFVGSFLRHNSISCRRLAFAIDFWSKGEMEALFLKHEGYFGALGTFLMSAFGEDLDKALSLDSQRRVLERFNHTDVSGGGGSNSNGAASSGSSGGNRRDSGGQGVPTGVTSPGAKFFLSSTADGSALKFVKRSRRDINNSSNNSGDRTGDNSGGSSSGNGKGMLYGIEREFLDRIRAWEPLSFANFRFHLSGDSSSRSSDSDGEKIVDKINSTNWWFPMNKKPNDDESLLSMNGSTVLPINQQSLSQSVDIFPPVVAKSRSHSDMFPSVESQTTTHKNGVSGSTDSEGAVNPTVSSSPIHPSISQRSMSMSDERPSTHSERTSISGTGNSSSSNLFSIGMSYDDSSLPSCHSPVSTMYPANSPR